MIFVLLSIIVLSFSKLFRSYYFMSDSVRGYKAYQKFATENDSCILPIVFVAC